MPYVRSRKRSGLREANVRRTAHVEADGDLKGETTPYVEVVWGAQNAFSKLHVGYGIQEGCGELYGDFARPIC